MANKGEPRDIAIRQEALTPGNSYIVQAPAGSGKTELLTQRFLKLLALVDSPEQILAITFTRKAAGEMRDRVLKAIESALSEVVPIKEATHKQQARELGKAVLQQDRARGWDLLANPGQLRIQTIDAFCASVVQQMPLQAGFGAATGIAEEDSLRNQLYGQAALNTIRGLLGASDDKAGAITRVLRHLDNNVAKLSELIADMLARRDQWERHVTGKNTAALREEFEGVLKRVVERALQRVSNSVPREHRAELIELLRCAEANLVVENKENKLEPLRGITQLPACTLGDLEKWRAIAAFLLTSGNWRRRMTIANGFPTYARKEKNRCEELLLLLKEQEPHHPDFRPALVALDVLPGTGFLDPQWQMLEALLEVLPVAISELKKLFQENAVTDFIEMAGGAWRAVDGSSGISGIRHMLVDEFQDTSVTQWRLLSALVRDWRPRDGRTLFLVGDPMQSIYRFRQAEVGLFIQAKREGIAEVKPIPLALEVNFRSSAALVDWFNDRFASIFGDRDDAAGGVVSYKECYAAPENSDTGQSIVRPEWVSSPEEEAERVVSVVQEALRKTGDVAILVRARTHLPRILAALRGNGIAFEAVDIQQLGEVSVIQDLLMLTRALLHPADRLAWIAVLRAPWCGLTLADLHAICGHDLYAAMWDCMNGNFSGLSEDGRMRVNRVRGVLVGALAARRRRPLREWVESTWIALGGPACVRERTELENAESFFELLEGIEADGASAEELSGLANGIFAKTETGSDIRVKVMTIHKAKGLEFDTVIVPGLGRGAQKDDARLLLWREGAAESGAELLLAPISQKGAEETDPIYRYLQKAEAERASEEEKRLLYVAVTRAKRNLYLVAQPVLTQKGELRQNRSLLRFLWPGLREDFRASETAKVEQPLALAASEESERGPRMLHRLTADWQLPAGPESLSWRAEETTGAVHDGLGITYDWVGEKLRHIGTVVHSMTQCIARDGLKCWPVGRIAQSRPIFRAALAERGLGANDLDEAVAQVEQALLTLITDERGQWILSPHADAQNEFSLSGVLDSGRVEHVVLDRTFIDEDGTRWIIDYKTARHEGSGLEAFLDNEQLRHKEQLERYAMLVRRLDPGRPIRFGLYFPLLSGWREWSDVG